MKPPLELNGIETLIKSFREKPQSRNITLLDSGAPALDHVRVAPG
jgi:hypothetical protein